MVSCCSNYMLYKLLCTYGLNKCAFEAVLPICVCLGFFCSMDRPLFGECFCFFVLFFCKLVFQSINLRVIIRRRIKCKIHDLVWFY